MALEVLDQELRVLEAEGIALRRRDERGERRRDDAAEAIAIAELAIDREQRLPHGAVARAPLAQELVDIRGEIDAAMGERAGRDAHREATDLFVVDDRRDLVREVARLVEITGGE